MAVTDLVPAIALLLRTCLCEAAAVRANPPADCCFRLPGEVPMDFSIYEDMCCRGLAYVSVADNWVSANSFPEQDIIRQTQSNCPPPSWGIELKMGIMRCAPVGTDTQPPTCEEWNAAAIQAMADAQTLRIAACCFRNAYEGLDPQLEGMSVVIGRQNANTAQGACVERTMAIQAQIPASCDGC